MKVSIDTNTYSEAARGSEHAVKLLREAEEICLPFVVLAELRAGFRSGTLGRKNESALTLFLNSQRVKILFADEQTTHHYSRIFADLRERGRPIPTNDLWIAALTVQHDLVLVSRDKHFDEVAQIVRKSF